MAWKQQLLPGAPQKMSSPAQPGNPQLRLDRTPQKPHSHPLPSLGVSGYLSVGPRVEKFGLLWAIFSFQGFTPIGEREA